MVGVRVVAAVPASGLIFGAAIGLIAADSLGMGRPASAGLLLAASIAVAIFAWLRGRAHVLAAAVAVGFFAGGFLLSSASWQRARRPPLRIAFEELARIQRAQAEAKGRRMPEDDEALAVVEGVLRADASPTASGVSLSINVDRLWKATVPGDVGRASEASGADRGGRIVATHGGIIVTVIGSLAASQIDDWRAGRRVRMPVTLRRASRYLDPGVPDNERALARRGTTLVGTVKSGALVEITARGSTSDEAFGALRAFSRRAIATAVGRWSPRSGAIVAAIVIGDRAGLDDEVQRRLQEAGTYHVIAISGGNIGILAGVLLGAFRIAGWLGRTAMACAIALLLAYARLVGGGASVDRATLMAVMYFGARALDQRNPPLNALAVVSTLLVLADPIAVVDPAFVLTCGATLAILLIVPAVGIDVRRLTGRGRTSRFDRVTRLATALLLPMFAASAATEALLFPVGAMLFARITFAGLALNFLAIPMMAVAQIAGMALVPIAVVSPFIAALVGWLAHLGAASLIQSADFVRFAPMLAYRVAPPAWSIVVAYYTAAGCWWILRGRVRRVCAACAVASALWILIDPRTILARGDGRLHLTFIDVGQGDSIFVVFPKGSTMLVDAGGLSSSSGFDIGDRVVAPVIRDLGFRRVDIVALTHGDPDHIGGAASIMAEFRPREAWEGIPVPRSGALAALRQQAQAVGCAWTNVTTGVRRAIEDVDVVVRHPDAADWERQKVRNDDSIVLEMRWRDVSILLTGDVGKVPERAIAASIPPAPIRIVKVAHHGSLTSSTPEFVNAIHPTIAVVSAGRANHFGHPVPEVLERYRAAGAEVFRTDRDGAVSVITDGISASVETFTRRHLTIP